MNKHDISILLPVLNETESFRQTLTTLLAQENIDLREIIILVAARTSEAALAIARDFQSRHPDQIQIVQQTRPHVGGAYQDGIDFAKGRLTVILASDLETDPAIIPQMIKTIIEQDCEIGRASKKEAMEPFSTC